MPDHGAPDIAEIIDFEKYPLAEPSRFGPRIVERCRAELADDGACQLDGFMRPVAVRAILDEAEMLSGRAFRTDAAHNVYFTEMPDGIPEGDPRRMSLHSAKRALGFKYCGASSPLRVLYEWDGLVSFLKDVLELPDLYRDADPMGACSVMLYGEGDELGWHFDNSEFAVTLMLQTSEGGGSFEFAPWIRDSHDERLGEVRGILAGARDRVLSLDGAPGTLALFQGRYSIHRVTPVEGKTPRVNAVLAYAQEPDHRLTQLNRELFYGEGQ